MKGTDEFPLVKVSARVKVQIFKIFDFETFQEPQKSIILKVMRCWIVVSRMTFAVFIWSGKVEEAKKNV